MGLPAAKASFIAKTDDEALAAVDTRFDGHSATREPQVRYRRVHGRAKKRSFRAVHADTPDAAHRHCARFTKRVGDGDTGPNTAVMGAYFPAPV